MLKIKISLRLLGRVFSFIIMILNISILGAKENVIFYPEFASYYNDSDSIEFEIHTHTFQLKESSLKRKLLIESMVKRFKLTDREIESKLFKNRIKWFLADNKKSREQKVFIGEKEIRTEKTKSNGHSYTHLKLYKNEIDAKYSEQGYIPISYKKGGEIVGKIYLVKQNDICLLSDIDDTIKISDVRNKEKLMENSFILPFRSVPGMSEFYRKLNESDNVKFFYVSASPWQLYSELSEYIQSESFPEGIFKMKQFRLKDSDAFSLLSSPQKYKYDTIESIIKKLPLNRFILVGDSGEKDPEAYYDLAVRYPNQVKKIFIRRAYKVDQENRFTGIFDRLTSDKWDVFDDPKSIDIEKLKHEIE